MQPQVTVPTSLWSQI